MSKSLSRRISIFISLDESTVYGYFNLHDPAPLYKRQLGHEFQEYLSNSIEAAKRNSIIRYKVICREGVEKRFADSLIHAIKRHFLVKKALKETEFSRFKKKSFRMLGISLAVVVFCQALFPVLFTDHNLNFALRNGLDVFSWVILWKPIDKLIFHWNPFLKELHLLNKLVNAETIVIEKHKQLS